MYRFVMYIHSHSFITVSTTILSGRGGLFINRCWDKFVIYMENKPDSNLIPYIQYCLKWGINPRVKSKIIRLLGENAGEYLHNLGIGKDFLNITQKAVTTRETIDKLDIIKIN